MRRIFLITKNQIATVGVIGLFVLSFFVLNLGIPSIMVVMMARPQSTLPLIVLDAGHGGMDGGAVSANGIIEKEINLNIANQLREYLLFSGFDVVMTREEDVSLHTTEKTVREQKTADLKARLKIMNESLHAVVISIHLNSFPKDPASKGAQVFYAPNGEQSKFFGNLAQKTLVETLNPANHRLAKESYDTIYVMRKALNTAILVECGFLSNAHEAALLTDEHYQNKIAFAIYLSLLRYLGADLAQNA